MIRPESPKYEDIMYKQQNYGGYCNVVRNVGLDPVPYHAFDNIHYKTYATKKEKIQGWIQMTEEYWG